MSQKSTQLKELESSPIGALLAKYSLPAIVGMAAMAAYNLVDSVYVGMWCNAFCIAAMALVFPIMNLTVAVGTLVGLGSAATASITLGQRDYGKAERVLGNCLTLSLMAGTAAGWLPLPWLREILVFFGAEGETLQPAYDFLLPIAIGFPISSTFMNLNHLMRSSGYPKKAMISLLLSMVVNVATAPLFIYILDWGIAGAGIATVVAQIVGLAWVLSHFFRRSSVLRFRPGIYRLQCALVKRIFSIGLAPCLLNACGCIVVVVFNHQFLAYDGPMGVGAYGVVNRIIFFFVLIIFGITQGVQPIAGYNLGMNHYRRVKRVLFYALIAASCISTIGFAVVQMFPREVVGLFAQNATDANSDVIKELGAQGIQLISYAFPLVGAQIIISNFFQAIGRPVMSICLNLTRQMFFLLPCLWLLPGWLGEKGIWLSQTIADFLSALVSLVVLYLFLTLIFTKKPANTLDKIPS